MSGKACEYVGNVLDDAELGTVDRLVAFIVAEHANVRTGIARCGIDRIARRAGIHVDTATRAVGRLAAAGVFAVERGGGRNRTNVYRFPVAATLSTTPALARGFDDQKPPRQRPETPAPASLNPRASAGGTGIEPVDEPRVANVALIAAAAAHAARFDEAPPAFTDAAGAMAWAQAHR